MKKAIAYLRVSTQDQAQQGAGLDLQRTRIDAFAEDAGYEIVEAYRDVQSGFDDASVKRKGLREAITRSRKLRMPIIVDGLDRFSRTTERLEELVAEGQLNIISARAGDGARRAVIMGEAKRAQAEVERIRRTTKEGLERARQRGAKFGNPTNLDEAQKRGAAANKVDAERRARELAPVIDQLLASGKKTRKELAEDLNGQGYRTKRGGRWTEHNLRRLLDRIETNNQTRVPDAYRNNPNFGLF